MKGSEFERRIKRYGKTCGLPVHFETHGKGSHGRLYLGTRFTTLKDHRKEIGDGLLNAMLTQLGLTRKDIGL